MYIKRDMLMYIFIKLSHSDLKTKSRNEGEKIILSDQDVMQKSDFEGVCLFIHCFFFFCFFFVFYIGGFFFLPLMMNTNNVNLSTNILHTLGGHFL